MDHAKRHRRLTERLEAESFGAVVLIPGPSLEYITGVSFHLMERPILGMFLADGTTRLILPGFEREKADESPLEFEYFTYGEEEGAALKALEQAVSNLSLDGSKVGVEPLSMRHFEQGMLSGTMPQISLAAADGVLSSLRIIKSDDEVAAMRRAVEIAEAALTETLPLIQAGMTELELASELTAQLLRAGSQPNTPFSPIVASGPNSAMGHATAGERELSPGDSLVLDWGSRYKGYVSDITRTFFVGEIPDELGQIHQIVQQANAAGRAAVRAGVKCGDVDRAAREVITEAGFGEYFIHRTGHGIGVEAHEPPFIREGEPTVLEAGMAFTVEPGIYLSGKGGVRVEDNVIATEEDGLSLTSFEREAKVVG